MHERAMVSDAVRQIEEAAGGRRIHQVEMALGPAVDREVVIGTFAQLTVGTAAQGVEVVWHQRLDTLSCLVCRSDYEGSKLDTCPACAGPGLVVEPAEDIAVLNVLVAD